MATHSLSQGVLSVIVIVTSVTIIYSPIYALGTEVPDNPQALGQVEIENFQVFTKIKYRYARTMVFCQMHNYHQTQGQEAVFNLDLPEDAFISNFTMEIIGNRMYKSVIKERKYTKERYDNARENGNTAGIVNLEEGQRFNVSINLAANSSVLFFLEYEEEIPKVHNFYEYSLSLIPQEVKVKHFCVDIEILEYKPFTVQGVNLRNKFGDVTILDLKKDAVILATEKENRTRIIWEPSTSTGPKGLSESGIVGKFQLRYHFNSPESLNDVVIRNGYFVYRFDSLNSTKKLPLYVIFVMDTSGSMIGLRGNRTKEAMEKVLLQDLDEAQDFFHVITFSSVVQHLEIGDNSMKRFYPATEEFKNGAREYINNQTFTGQTNIGDALTEALEMAGNSSSLYKDYCRQLKTWGSSSTRCSNNSEPTPMIFFLTDGYPSMGITNRETILKQIQKENTNRVPIFSIGLGNDADHSLLETLSIMNHGIARKIYNDADVVLQLQDFYKLVASPVLKDIQFWYTNRNSELSKSFEVSYNGDRPWLGSQDEIVLTGRRHKQQPIITTKLYQTDGNNDSSVKHHGLYSHHGLEQLGYTVYKTDMDMDHAEFKARICKCGICPRSNDTKNLTDFLSSFEPGDTLCQRNDEDDTFMERFWVHKTLKGLIKKAVMSGSERIKQEIISLSKQYNLVTTFTSLLILVPIDKKGSNMRYYTPPSVPNIMHSSDLPNNDIISKPFMSNEVKHSNKLGFYSGTSKSNTEVVENKIEVPPSLAGYLRSLHDAQENATKYRNLSTTSINPKLSIFDIKWIVGENFMLHLSNKKRNETGVFHVMTNLLVDVSGSKHQPCTLAKRPGRCVHLTSCLEPNYTTNITIFLKKYFCPIISESNTKYIGTCCTILNTNLD